MLHDAEGSSELEDTVRSSFSGGGGGGGAVVASISRETCCGMLGRNASNAEPGDCRCHDPARTLFRAGFRAVGEVGRDVQSLPTNTKIPLCSLIESIIFKKNTIFPRYKQHIFFTQAVKGLVPRSLSCKTAQQSTQAAEDLLLRVEQELQVGTWELDVGPLQW